MDFKVVTILQRAAIGGAEESAILNYKLSCIKYLKSYIKIFSGFLNLPCIC